MANILSFSEDMLPRHFPRAHFLKAAEQSEQISVVPQPTLPGVSLIFSSEQKSPKIEPKKSFQKWKQQHQAILINKTTDHQVKTVEVKSGKKHVTFETKDHFERSLPAKRIQPLVNPKLELSYYEPPNSKEASGFYQRPNLHHQNKLYQTQRTFHKPNLRSTSGVTTSSEFVNNNRPRTNVSLQQYVSVQESEFMKGNCLYRAFGMGNNNQNRLQAMNSTWSHSNPCCCQLNENYFQSDDVINRTEHGSNGISERQQELQPSVNILINILEEQQQRLLLQQNQISEQQKQICILQYQLQQLLQLNEAIDAISPVKEHKSTISNEVTHEVVLQTENGSRFTPSIGVTTNFLDHVNDKRTKEKLILGREKSHNYACQDDWLDQANTNIRNSSDFIDYGINESYPPNRHSDRNISQTLIYGALSTNSSCVNSQKEIDRSYYLNMLGMKYKCTESDSPLYTDQQGVYNNQFNVDVKSDRLREDVPSDTYDYLIRHGLMKR